MDYLYEIQVLQNKIRNNNENIERLERGKNQISSARAALKAVDKNRVVIDEMRWRGFTTSAPKEIVRAQYHGQEHVFDSQKEFWTLFYEAIANLEMQNGQYRLKIQTFESKSQT